MYYEWGLYRGDYLYNIEMMNRSKVYTVVMNPDLHKNLQRISLEEDTNVSAIIRQASEQYLQNYLQGRAGAK